MQNAVRTYWPLVIAVVSIAAWYGTTGYRISALEKQATAQQEQLERIRDQQIEIEVQLAEIAVDITYIKEGIRRLVD